MLETSKNGPKIQVFPLISEILGQNLNFQYKNLDFWTEFDVKHPLHHLQKAVDATSSSIPEFQWTPPKSIVITEKGQQIFIEIPPKALGNRDFLNLTYAAKRGHFACHVARLLSGKFEKVEFTAGGAHRDDPIFADILVDGVRIGFYCPELAKTKRFAPNIGNLRPATIFEDLFKGFCLSFAGKSVVCSLET